MGTPDREGRGRRESGGRGRSPVKVLLRGAGSGPDVGVDQESGGV